MEELNKLWKEVQLDPTNISKVFRYQNALRRYYSDSPIRLYSVYYTSYQRSTGLKDLCQFEVALSYDEAKKILHEMIESELSEKIENIYYENDDEDLDMVNLQLSVVLANLEITDLSDYISKEAFINQLNSFVHTYINIEELPETQRSFFIKELDI